MAQLLKNLGIHHEAIKPIGWLLGRWKSQSAKGSYPTIKPFSYGEVVEFSSLGQPLLNYATFSYKIEDGSPIHLEKGFLRIKPGTNELSFVVAHNLGYCIVEEGSVSGNKITLESKSVESMSFVREPLTVQTKRIIQLNEGILEQKMYMGTVNTPLTLHLDIQYERIN